MHACWIGVMLGFFLMLILFTVVNGKAFLENEGRQNYYSENRNQYQPVYQNYEANPKLFYTPQIDGQPIYIPAISGSEHVNKFLDDYYKINRDHTQSWTLAPPFGYITSESSYYENGATANSMIKNFLEEKYKDGAYSGHILPPAPGNLPKQEKKTDHKHKDRIEQKDYDNKKTHDRRKKRPHGVPTESSYFTQYKLKTKIPADKRGDENPVLVKSDISGDDYDEIDQISTVELKKDKIDDSKKEIKIERDYSKGVKIKDEKLKKDKQRQSPKHKNKSKSEHVSKSYMEDYVTNSPNMKPPNKEKTETSKYSTSKTKNKVSVEKTKPEVEALNELSDSKPEIVDVINEDDSKPEIVDVINEDYYEPEVAEVINELSDYDYEPEVVDVNKLSDDYQQDSDIDKILQTKDFETDNDYDESTNFSSKKDNKKNKNIKGSAYSKEKNEKPQKGKHQSVKISNKPNKHVKDTKDPASDGMNLYKPEKIVQSPKGNSKKTENKMPADNYKTDVVDKVNKLSDNDYEPEAIDEVESSEDFDPEVDVFNKLSDEYDGADLSDIDLDPEVDIINEEKNLEAPKPEMHLGNDLDNFTSGKDKTKPSKPVKTKPSKPVKTKPSKPVKTKPSIPEKTKDYNKNADKYNESKIKSTNPSLKAEVKDESEQKYETDGHIRGKVKDAFLDESVIENQMGDKEIHSRDLLDQPTDIPNEIEEFDGSGSQAIDTSMRRFPQFFKNVGSIRNLTSLNSNIWSLIFNPNAERNELKKCVTRSNETGICMYVHQCEVPNIATSLEQLLNNACVIDDVFIGVCCPEFPVQTVKVHWDQMPSSSDKQSEDEFGHSTDDCGIRSDDAKKIKIWPWQAPLVSMSNGKIFCGGVIINDDYILTAAHCTTKIPKNQILVRLGQHDEASGDDFAVVEIKRHAQYNPRTMHNDIALLKLGKRIVRDKHTDAICLPEDDDDDHEDEKAVLLGIKGGFSQSSKQTEWLKVISNKDCEKKLGSKVPATLLCTEARDENERTCNLDSGAPLVVEDDDKYEVIGILSWNRNDCDERFPSTFSRVSKYVRWIQKHAV